MRSNYLTLAKLQRLHRWSLGMDKYWYWFHNIAPRWNSHDQGPVSISEKTSFRNISWSLEATRLVLGRGPVFPWVYIGSWNDSVSSGIKPFHYSVIHWTYDGMIQWTFNELHFRKKKNSVHVICLWQMNTSSLAEIYMLISYHLNSVILLMRE